MSDMQWQDRTSSQYLFQILAQRTIPCPEVDDINDQGTEWLPYPQFLTPDYHTILTYSTWNYCTRDSDNWFLGKLLKIYEELFDVVRRLEDEK